MKLPFTQVGSYQGYHQPPRGAALVRPIGPGPVAPICRCRRLQRFASWTPAPSIGIGILLGTSHHKSQVATPLGSFSLRGGKAEEIFNMITVCQNVFFWFGW